MCTNKGEGTRLQQSLTSNDCKRLSGVEGEIELQCKAECRSKSPSSRLHPISSPLESIVDHFIKLTILHVYTRDEVVQE